MSERVELRIRQRAGNKVKGKVEVGLGLLAMSDIVQGMLTRENHVNIKFTNW